MMNKTWINISSSHNFVYFRYMINGGSWKTNCFPISYVKYMYDSNEKKAPSPACVALLFWLAYLWHAVLMAPCGMVAAPCGMANGDCTMRHVGRTLQCVSHTTWCIGHTMWHVGLKKSDCLIKSDRLTKFNWLTNSEWLTKSHRLNKFDWLI